MKIKDVALALLSSVLLLLAFPKSNLEVMAWIALVPLLHCLRGKGAGKAFILGWLFGLVFFLGQLYWVSPMLQVYGQIPTAASIFTMAALIVYLSLYFALFAAILSLCEKRLGNLSWLFVPLLWTTLEYARENAFFLGFPWGALGYSQYRNLQFIQVADITGVLGVTFGVMLVNSAAARFIQFLTEYRNEKFWCSRLLYPVMAAGIVIAALYLYGNFRLKQIDRIASSSDKIRVAMIQGNISQNRKWDDDNVNFTLDRYITLTRQTSTRKPLLTVWPETAVPFFFQREDKRRERVMRLAEEADSYLLFGSPAYGYADGGTKYYNSAFLLSPDGEEKGRYDKQRLVPFGEYVPLKWLFSFVDKIVVGEGEFSKGKGADLLSVEDIPFGVLICFEILFPDLARRQARRGARFLVNITNDAWFGRTSAPYQHFSIGAFRAIENRLSLVRAANTGITGLIAPSGAVIESTEIFEDGWLVEETPMASGLRTAYTRFGDLFAWGVVVFTIITPLIAGNRYKTPENYST